MTDPIKAALGRTPACPSVEALAGAALNADIQGHIETCGHCRAELALLHAFESDEPRPEELASVQWIEGELRRKMRANTVTVASPSFGDRLAAWLGQVLGPGRSRGFAMAAASLLIIAGAGVLLRQGDTIQSPANDGVVWRSGRFAAISPSGEITGSPAELRWESVSGAVSYRVQLLEVDRTEVWTGDSSETTVPIPVNVRVQLRPGRAFQWQVIARNAAGEKIASTDLQNFHIAVTPH